MIADTLPVETKAIEERGLPQESYFTVFFSDGSFRTEKDTNWSSFGEVETVEYFGGKKQVSLAKLPVVRIEVVHEDMNVALDVPHDCQAYQAILAEVQFMQTGRKQSHINGRCVGLVRDGKVIEERILNARTHEIIGMKL